MDANHDEFLWVERWRPHTIADCILPKNQQDTFAEFVKKGEVPNMILSGTSGVGKTTVARAMCEEIGCDYIIINGSEDSGIDMLRTKLRQFASSVSFSGKVKVAIIDEADYLNPNSTQPAFRGFIEEFSKNCRFIFTCNNKNKIIPQLHSRATVIDFKIEKSDRPKMAAKFMARVQHILAAEGIVGEEAVVAELLKKYFPDYRRILGELQVYGAGGVIDAGILRVTSDSNLKPLITALREKDFKKMRVWVANNEEESPQILFRKLFDEMVDKVTEAPQLVLLLADYGYKSAFCADQTINTTACMTEIMASVSFK